MHFCERQPFSNLLYNNQTSVHKEFFWCASTYQLLVTFLQSSSRGDSLSHPCHLSSAIPSPACFIEEPSLCAPEALTHGDTMVPGAQCSQHHYTICHCALQAPLSPDTGSTHLSPLKIVLCVRFPAVSDLSSSSEFG